MPKKVPNIQRIINNDILKIVNIVFSGGGCPPAPPPPAVYGPECALLFFTCLTPDDFTRQWGSHAKVCSLIG
jgi:hypothetical protein